MPAAKGRSYAGMSLKERRTQRKQKFLDAGLRCFGTEGYRATTVRAICKEAQLTDRYFYESFGSQEKLVIACYEHCMVQLTKRTLHAITSSYAQDQHALNAVRAGLDAFYSELEDPATAQICLAELEGISPEVNALYNTYMARFSDIIVCLAEYAYPAWQLSNVEKEVLGVSLVGALRQSATHWCATDYAIAKADMIRGTLYLFEGLLAPLEASRTAQ